MGAPEGWLGGFVPLRIVLVRNARLLITLGPMEAYPTGVSIELQVTSRQPRHFGGREDDDGGMQVGVAYGDGSKWQGFGERWPSPGEKSPPSPMMWSMGGGGSDRHFSYRYWLWPLPPPGPVTFALTWPERGVEETTIEIDSGVFRAAAEEAQKLWEPLTEEEEEAAMRAGDESRGFTYSVGVLVKDEADEGEK